MAKNITESKPKDKIELKISDGNYREFFVNDTYITFWTADFENAAPDTKLEFLQCITNDFYHDDEWFNRVGYLEDAKISDELLKEIVDYIKLYTNWDEIIYTEGNPCIENDTIFTQWYKTTRKEENYEN